MNRRELLASAIGSAVVSQTGTSPLMLEMIDGVKILDTTTTPGGTVLLSCSNGRILSAHPSDYGGWMAGWLRTGTTLRIARERGR